VTEKLHFFEEDMIMKKYKMLVLLSLLAAVSTEASAIDYSTLFQNQILFKGQRLVANGCLSRLEMQSDGNLVLYDLSSGRALWTSNTVGRNGYTIMQSDGNLVMYNWNNVPFWSTNTWGHNGGHLVMQDDANLVVYHNSTPLWASNTNRESLGSTTCDIRASKTGTEPNWDRPGGDYVHYKMNTANYSHCAYWCSQDNQCQAFTYVPPGVQGNTAMCWLKNTIPAKTYAPGMVSGYVARE
jgi:hypothetical protein